MIRPLRAVSYAAAEDAAEGMNLVIENYNRGVQITWQVYTPEEIAENSSLGMVQLYYFPAKTANAKYAIVVPGNGGNTTAELNEGASIANQLHELGYAAFSAAVPLFFLNASGQCATVRYCQRRKVPDRKMQISLAFSAKTMR